MQIRNRGFERISLLPISWGLLSGILTFLALCSLPVSILPSFWSWWIREDDGYCLDLYSLNIRAILLTYIRLNLGPEETRWNTTAKPRTSWNYQKKL
ncbi:hypothetical protein Y1Q_0010708 [Alligator mississippiensis]|uniref:Uncharacterized protein n=1 Tax=Alligator mississippiensis TaxID=8496 RepID=A0A151M6R4_ALLMI|nr:hypothetical protein Y1Q_0010708 [Alligator mississippiensis]